MDDINTLTRAAAMGDLEKVKTYIDDGEDANSIDKVR